MHWSAHSIWWQLHPLTFTGAEREALPPAAPPIPRLARLSPWLDYLVELGCNGLALGPVFASETHGYDTVDHFRVDSRLGEEADLLRLVEEARARGVRILLDGVFNHVGRGFPALQDLAAHEPDGTLRVFEGHQHLVTLDHSSPQVADYVTEVMTHWLDRGIAGWRLDAAYAVPPAFWRTVTARVRARHPDAWLTGEVIHGDYAGFVTEGGLDSVTQYELWKAIWSALNDHNLHELAWALTRHNALLDTFTPQTFVGNHDVTRLASRLNDTRHLPHALAVLLTTGGVPSIYAGDEQAFRGIKEDREGGDDEIRPTFPAHPTELAPYGEPHHRLHQHLLGVRRRNPWLTAAHTTPSTLTNETLAYTTTHADRTLAVALNLTARPTHLPLPTRNWQVAAGEGEFTPEGAKLPAHGWLIGTPRD
ncbi:alpha-amylase family glycosyl hydrolase [Streptomyces geranii]|uniref:alpha-amylase family glycosyl hydrolase n=1 Tax=Streptomyces geranii TaxID=2058923 RepID=UPI000D02C2CD|nr:alpha-amylase family glycosyl hydrolase [Streptomyces geranii]